MMNSAAVARWFRSSILIISVVWCPVTSFSAQPTFDQAAWDGVLQRYVAEGLVDYDGLRADRASLDRYLASLSAADPSRWPSQEARLAFWINAYNACVFKGVLDHFPVKSVKEVRGFFDRLRYQVAGRDMTLNQIEREGRVLGDWRIHVAVVCASSSCPPLRAEAYVPERLNDQLADQATQFLKDPRHGLRLDGSTLWLSKIMDWYAGDFLKTSPAGPAGKLTSEALLPVLTPYLDAGVVSAISQQKPGIKFFDYDWSLNIKSQRAVAAEVPVSEPEKR
ncbi:MAG: DUF547 domain-containing protein [Candidatus Omnitrophica bacterium]|nr:DUF547 domain-containing protein [Candidatus Omnitrophota bacterium]